MLTKSTRLIVIALFTAAVLIGLAFNQRYGSPLPVSAVTFYIAAAIIWVSPVVYRVLRCKSREYKASKVG